MRKKSMVLLAVTVLTLVLTTSAVAATVTPPAGAQAYGYGCGDYVGLCYSLMRDAGGRIVSQDVFEKNLDKAIANGTIREADRSFFVDRYNTYCAQNVTCRGGGRRCGR